MLNCDGKRTWSHQKQRNKHKTNKRNLSAITIGNEALSTISRFLCLVWLPNNNSARRIAKEQLALTHFIATLYSYIGFLPLHYKKVAQSCGKKLSLRIKHAICRNANWSRQMYRTLILIIQWIFALLRYRGFSFKYEICNPFSKLKWWLRCTLIKHCDVIVHLPYPPEVCGSLWILIL